MKKYLIITADDFGFSKERNQGIANVFKHSAVTGASLLLNSSGTNDAVEMIRNQPWCTGLHLNLTEGHSLHRTKHSTLTNSNGEFWGKFELRRLLENGSVSTQEIKEEIKSQIEMFTSLVGKRPPYVDGHQHIHVHPALALIFASTLQECGIPATRLPIELYLAEKSWMDSKVLPFYHKVIEDSKKCKAIFDSCGVRYTDSFVGLSIMGANMTPSRLQDCISQAFDFAVSQQINGEPSNKSSSSHVSCELMSHPGLPTGKDSGGFNMHSDQFGCSEDRKHEISILTSKQMLDFYHDNDICLVSYEDIWPEK